MALHTWGGQAAPQPNECTVIIAPDGSVTAQTSTQDLGTGQRTVTAIVVAEILGLEPNQITLRSAKASTASRAAPAAAPRCPSQAPATLRAATAARDDLFAKIATKLNAEPDDLAIEPGKVVDNEASNKTWTWKEACARLGMEQVKVSGVWTAGEADKDENKNVSSNGVGGVQVAEVTVDTETGVVRCTHVMAVQDCGMIVNKLACESQVAGGVIMGVNYALFEERIMDADRPAGQPGHGVLQAGRHRGHAEDCRAHAGHAGARRHRHRRAADDLDARRHRQRRLQRHRRPGAARPVHSGTGLAALRHEGREGLMKNFTYYRPQIAEASGRPARRPLGANRAARRRHRPARPAKGVHRPAGQGGQPDRHQGLARIGPVKGEAGL